MSSTNSSNGRRPSSVEFHSTSVNLWSRNPLTSLFRRSKRKEEKHRRVERDAEVNAKEDERKLFDKTRHRPKRSSSCDALSHGRLGTRFDVTADGAEMSSGTLQRDVIGRSTRRRKRSGGDRLQQQQQHNNNNQQDISLCSTDPAQSSSFSSLLHQRIFLCSRGASPLVPFFYQKSAKTKCSAADHFDSIEIEGKKQQQKASRSHQNISRLIRDESNYRRDHSLDSSKVPSCVVRAVPIVRIPFTSSASSSSTIGGTVPFPAMGRHHRHLYERREEFFHRRAQCQQNGAKMSWEQRAAEVEEWMQTQPISLRKLEQHERLRLMVAAPNKSQTLRVPYFAKVPMKKSRKNLKMHAIFNTEIDKDESI
uniref:Uncharacterized protein n=1 Tax=Globodera rostochiensis TaxID=31243 RepID=A0A914HSY1_GLORO